MVTPGEKDFMGQAHPFFPMGSLISVLDVSCFETHKWISVDFDPYTDSIYLYYIS